jgi:hypothetical protein
LEGGDDDDDDDDEEEDEEEEAVDFFADELVIADCSLFRAS